MLMPKILMVSIKYQLQMHLLEQRFSIKAREGYLD